MQAVFTACIFIYGRITTLIWKGIIMDADGRKQKKGIKYWLLSPLVLLQKGLTALLKAALGESFTGGGTEDEIMSLVDAGSENGSLESDSAEMIGNVFEFNDLTASDVMTHRVNIIAVEENVKLDDIVYLALEEGFSRIPVYRDSIDRIVGIIIVKDLLCLIGNHKAEEFTASDFVRDIVYVPESCPCSDAFKQLTDTKSGMAVVVDEYGGTAGIITVEDLIEAVMGNIQDEYDDEAAEIRSIGKDKYEINGECDPDDVLELFGYQLPEDHEYDTVAGFVTDLLGYIPEDVINPPHVDYEDVRFVVTEVEENCIRKIIAVRKEPSVKQKSHENED